MKKLSLFFILTVFLYAFARAGEPKIPAYYNAGTFNGSLSDAIAQVQTSLSSAGFEILGQYHPANNENLAVLVFTHSDLKKVCAQVKDRGFLAAALKVGFIINGGKTEISFVNPEYLFNAYFGSNYSKFQSELSQIDKNVKAVLKMPNSTLIAFGGSVEQDDLQEYQYMWGMEEFDDPVTLGEFTSFAEGLRIIRNNLQAGKAETVKVYELVDAGKNVAVFGVGMMNTEDGEAFFLPIIGEKHVAAMPYEIILQGNKATMLHGRYRIALHWPELKMGTFTKIISTPGYIEDTFKALCK